MSDYRKSITFQAKIDTSEIGPTIEALKRQFNQATSGNSAALMQAQTAARLSQQGMGGNMSVPKPEDIAKSRRALDQFIREQSQQQEKLYKLLENQRDKMKNLNEMKRDSLKDSKEELALEEKKKSVLEQYIRMDEQYKERDKMLNRALDTSGGRGGSGGGGRNLLNGADWSGVMPPSRSGGGSFAKGVGSISAVMLGVAKAVDTLAGFPMRLEEAKGSATQSFIGRDIGALQSGQAGFDQPWMAERAKAAEMAKSRSWWRHGTDIGTGLAGAGLIAGGLATGAAAIAGTPFTMGGSALGLPVAGGMLAAGGAALFGDRHRQSINPFGQGSYNKLLESEQGTETLSTWEAIKQQDPRKGAAIDRLQGRYSGDLAAQRMMGLRFGGSGMFGGVGGYAGVGGFQEQANNAGFTGDMASAMAAQIGAGGGSTRGMRGLSTLGLQAQRQFDLTNSGGVLGKISGVAGDSKTSEQIFRKVMEESIKAGLDKSEFAEEQRKFADVTSDILSRSGVRTAEDASQVLAGFSKFLGGGQQTGRTIEGARGAYEQSQAFSAETGGRGGALQFAAFMKRPSLRALGPMGLGAIAEIPDKDIHSSNPFIISSAAEAGLPVDEFVRQVKGAKREKQLTELGLNSKKVDSLSSALSSRHFDPYSQKDVGNLSADELKTYQDVSKAVALRYQSGTVEERNAATMGILGMSPGASGNPGATYDEKMNGTTGRPEDEVIRAAGVAAQEMLQNFRNYKDVITPASQSLKEFADAIMAVKTASDINGHNAYQRYQKALPGSMKSQTQAGKPSK